MPPTVHVSEYDIGRAYNVTLVDENGNAFHIPTGTTATVEGTLNGAVGFSVSATISNNQITFALTESMTAYAGKAWCKIKLTLNNQPIQTCAFVLAVDRAGVEAETVIGAPGFEEQIQDAVDNYLDEHGTAVGAVRFDQQQSLTDAEKSTARNNINAPDKDAVNNALSGCVKHEQMSKCTLIEGAASANRWNPETVQTGLITKAGLVYTGGSYDNYRYNEITGIIAGDVITMCEYYSGRVIPVTIKRVAAFDANGNAIAEKGVGSDTSAYTVPDGIAKLWFCVNTTRPQVMLLVNATETPTEYIPYSDGSGGGYYVATPEFLPDEVFDGLVKEDGVNQVTAKNCQFMDVSPNLIDLDSVVTGKFVNQANGNLADGSLHTASGLIPVVGGSSYVMSLGSGTAEFRFCWYDANQSYISGEFISPSVSGFTRVAPSNASYFRFSSTSGWVTKDAQFEQGTSATSYKPYGIARLNAEYAPVEVFDPVVNLPSDLYALVGYELNVYFENLVEDWTKYDFNVNCDKGMQLERGYRITPTADDVGNYTLSIKISNGKDSTTVSTTLHVIAASANSGVTKTVMVLGDSTTNNGIAVTKLNDNFTNDVMNITLVGTRGTAPNLHEGRSGWTFNSYFNPPNAGDIASGVENPWYNPTTQTFDASYYFTNTGITKPNWLFINLGINDVFGYETDSALETGITNCESLCDSMIASIKSASPSTKIGLCLTIPPNHSQDAFGKAYKCGQTRDRYKRNNLLWVHSLIETYSNRASDGIYLIPIYTNLDTVYNMGLETLPVNARNTDVTYQSPIGNGGVHPVSSGYWQIADVYTAFLKAQS